jgi:hypothetical protein
MNVAVGYQGQSSDISGHRRPVTGESSAFKTIYQETIQE